MSENNEFSRQRWFMDLEGQTEWYGYRDVRFQLDGMDLVTITDMNVITGDATVRVYASTSRTAPVIFEGVVNVSAHLAETCGLCGKFIQRDEQGRWVDELDNAPELCLLNEPEPDQFGPHEPISVPTEQTEGRSTCSTP